MKRLAQANHFEMTDAEMRALEAMIPGLFDSYDALSRYGLLLMPATPMPAHRNDAVGDPQAVIEHAWDMLANTAPFDMSGHPAISVPCGKTSEGLPVGLMLVRRRFDDATVLRAANAFEQSGDWETM